MHLVGGKHVGIKRLLARCAPDVADCHQDPRSLFNWEHQGVPVLETAGLLDVSQRQIGCL